jgi:radical SAM protein with 4Fe4S-binding SPASM domain
MARLYLHGEPMLHPQIVEMANYVKRKGMAIHLVTNGTLVTRDQIKGILNSNVNRADRVIFSILGYSKEVHERIMRGVDHYQVLKNLALFLELRKESGLNGPAVEVIFYAMPENEMERREFYEYWHGVVDHVQVVGWTSKQFADFNDEHRNSVPVRGNTCNYLWDRMTIFWNGDVTICMADVDGIHRFGNVGEQSISEIWNSQAMLSIKRLHKERRFQDIPLCNRCDW